MKRCIKCKIPKSLDSFSKNRKAKDGRVNRCKQCDRVRYDEKKEHIKQSNLEYAHRKKQEFNSGGDDRFLRVRLWNGAKFRAAEKGVPFSITVEDIVIPSICPILGLPLKINDGAMDANSPTLDRIIPEQGYVPGNVQVISNRANMMKHNATAAEVIALAEWLKSYPSLTD